MILACPHCDTLVHCQPLAHNHALSCPNCRSVLIQSVRFREQKVIALAFAALLFLILSVAFEFLRFSERGFSQTITLLDAPFILLHFESTALSLVIFVVIFLLPLCFIAALIPLHMGLLNLLPERYGAYVLKAVLWLKPWCMAEIFLIGILVSLIKVMSLADVYFGPSFWAYIGFVLCYAMILVYFSPWFLWQSILPHWQGDTVPEARRAIDADLHLCHRCHMLTPLTTCPRCHGNTYARKPYALHKVWALSITAALLYIPANVLPIMHTTFLGQTEGNTIISGVVSLWQSDSKPIAMVIFIASVIIPIFKISVLLWLSYLLHKGAQHGELAYTKIYQAIEFIGKWSMIDVFVVTILVALVQLGRFMEVTPGQGAFYFACMVVTSMLAAHAFDPRLLWDPPKEQ